MAITRWNPNRELSTLDDEFNRFFRSFWGGRPDRYMPELTQGFLPPVDVEETRDKYLVTVELPGMSQKDVKVTVVDNALVIKGEKRSEHFEPVQPQRESREGEADQGEAGYPHRMERTYGRFERILQLATKVDRGNISATMRDGVLHIEIPKTEEAKEREISVQVK